MAISIDWGAKIINVPRADMSVTQVDPEIRELDLETFRLALKDLEDGVEGMCFPDTHRHNTVVSIGGIVLAQVIEIINGYTVTFEDGQYSVNATGANSNLLEVKNANQVSLRTNNSAGLTTPMADALLDDQNVESGISFRNSQRLMLAALAGLVSGAEGATITFKNTKQGGGTKNRIVASVDQYGNRSEIVFDLTDE